MKYFSLVCILLFSFQQTTLFSQSKNKREKTRITYRQALDGQLDSAQLAGVNRTLEYRYLSFDFYQTMRRIAEPSTISFFGLDQTYQLNRDFQKKTMVLNADIRTPITLGGKWWITGAKRKHPSFHTFHIMPQFKIRIFQNDPAFNDSSLPVRTPSYLPGITYFCSKKKWWTPRAYDTEGKVAKFQKGFFYGIRLFHHSNGQDGPEFNPDGTLNVYNGNFGENIVPEFMIGGVKESLGGKFFDLSNIGALKRMLGDGNLEPNRHRYWKLGFEPHLGKVFGMQMTSAIFDSLNIYGRYRVNAQLGISFIPSFIELIDAGDKEVVVAKQREKELLRLTVNFSYIVDGKYYRGDLDQPEKIGFFNIARRLNLYASVHVRIKGTQHASGFVQVGYFGSDNYNIYFQQNLFHFRAGISMAFYKYPVTGDLVPARSNVLPQIMGLGF